jgi:hypothetical protein
MASLIDELISKENLQQLIVEIGQEEHPTSHTLGKCISILRNYPEIMKQEKQKLSANDLSEYHQMNKKYIDHLTWGFSQIFDEVAELGTEGLDRAIAGYRELVKLNHSIISEEFYLDYRHLGFSPLARLISLYERAGNKKFVKDYQEKEEKRKESIRKSDALAEEGISKLVTLWENFDFGERITTEAIKHDLNTALSKLTESLSINPYHSKARAMLGFIYSTQYLAAYLNGLFIRPDHQLFPSMVKTIPDESHGEIPILTLKDPAVEPIHFELGVDFQEKYYLPGNWKLYLNFKSQKFGESNNFVFRYERTFSPELKILLADYTNIVKDSVFKFYGNKNSFELELDGMAHFKKKKIKIPKVIRKASEGSYSMLEMEIIRGGSMYEVCRELEREAACYDEDFKETIEKALIDKHIFDLVKIQQETIEVGEIVKLKGGIEPNNFEQKLCQVVNFFKKKWKLEIEVSPTLAEFGKILDHKVGNKTAQSEIVVYKDASPRNTKVDLQGIIEELGIARNFSGENYTPKTVISFIYDKYVNGLSIDQIADTFSRNLYQLDFEKINRVSSEFDDLLECIEFPFFYLGKSKEEKNKRGEKWEDKYRLFLSLKNKENKAEELKEEYFLFSVNRSIRWLYYLSGWFERSEGKDKQHLEDMSVHIDNAYRAMDWLEEHGKQNPKSTAAEFNFMVLREVIQSIEEGNEVKLAQWKS